MMNSEISGGRKSWSILRHYPRMGLEGRRQKHHKHVRISDLYAVIRNG
jgi:hypothetical protein